DEAYDVQRTVDGGYIIAGGIRSYEVDGADFWLVKTDSDGNEQWNKTFGSTGHDEAYAAQQTTDGGYILAGYTSSHGAGNGDAWLVKVAREEPVPHALFTYTPKNPFTTQLIIFDASSSYDPYRNITNYEWDFGDGNITNTTGMVITYSYVLEGDYTVNLTVTNDVGSKDSTSKVVRVPSPEGDWSKTFGGSGYEEAQSVQQTADGGYILVGGTSYGAGSDDVWLVKTDLYGNELWNRTFGSPGMDKGYSIQQTADGGYIFAGMFDWNYFWLVKTDSNGTELWNSTFGGGEAWEVQQTADGFISIGIDFGAGDTDFWLVNVDANGDEYWNQTFGGSDNEWASSGQQTLDGGYILTGCTFSYGAGDGDFWLVKTDSNGTELWNRTFGGPYWDWAFSVQQTSDSGYILTGFTESYGAGSSDFWLIKTDSSGNEQWNKTFGGTDFDTGYSVVQTSFDEFIITGGTESYGAGGRDVWLIKTDSAGNELWNRTFGGYELDEAFSVQQTTDRGYVLAGVTMSYGTGDPDAWLVKVKGEPTVPIFDTEPSENPYPSIMGTHNGAIIPSCNINVSKLYTYSCVGTGGHTESIELYDENDTLIANGTWNGYIGDYHNITLHNVSGAPYVMLLEEHKYNYTIITGSYPQIIHARSKDVTGGVINCTEFIDANGKEYNDWIPAIKLE
ncbi:MAG: PKD domain-containing protein, partial [Methanophagales archaeon]|nr:PKD domain-containing protein [Methanophagales archaeon]